MQGCVILESSELPSKMDDVLLKEAKKYRGLLKYDSRGGARNAMRESFARRHKSAKRKRIVLSTFKGTGTLPGVNMEDWASVVESMDEDSGALR